MAYQHAAVIERCPNDRSQAIPVRRPSTLLGTGPSYQAQHQPLPGGSRGISQDFCPFAQGGDDEIEASIVVEVRDDSATMGAGLIQVARF